MKISALNKFYSVNIFIYTVVVKAISTFLFFLPFWHSQIFYNYFDYLFWISCILGIICCLLEIAVYITLFAMPIEFVLYKLKKIKRTPITISVKYKIIIWFVVILSLLYFYWFYKYYYPIIEQQLIMD